ncbi:hypothetical protein SDC9_60350 [bioreactor metagenome]|jgi:hypothetical protein|uniref:DUF3626 domain-containing protein n=1 Tax=bioreactor metagenome TaxID=1076179 RepID=A0A644XCP3_9ZZZZ
MLDYQIEAIDRVRKYAKSNNAENMVYLEHICEPFNIDVWLLINQVLSKPITINFHPDRFSNGGKTIMENLLEQGQYHGQFRTGTTNGGKSAFIGGDRFLWEQRIFFDAYPHESVNRPKYGALNLFQYIDGASVRFGSCFFTLKQDIVHRCTFAYGDSSTYPQTLCTSDTFEAVLVEIFKDVKSNGRMLNQAIASEQETLAILLSPHNKPKHVGRNLDYCIETHIHGDISLKDDVQSFYMDESFQGTTFATLAENICQKYDIELNWIPKRQMNVHSIGGLFRGPQIPLLAQRIDEIFGSGQGVINSFLIGQASRDTELHPEKWANFGTEAQLFQYIKQIWHTVGYFG